MSNGWIKLHRKLLDNPIAQKPAWLSVWIHLLLLANHGTESSFIWNKQKIALLSGQFVTGRKKLKELTGVSETTIEDILNYLETQHQIRQQKTTKYRLITILNWNEYQKSDIISDSKATTERQQSDTFKNVRMKEEEKMPPEGDVVKELLEDKKGINHDFQFIGLEVFDKTGAPKDKKGECMRLAKKYPSFIQPSLSFCLDYPNPSLKWKMFLWKLNGLIKASNEINKGNSQSQ